MAHETNDWNAPEVTPLTEDNAVEFDATARIKNGGALPPSSFT